MSYDRETEKQKAEDAVQAKIAELHAYLLTRNPNFKLIKAEKRSYSSLKEIKLEHGKHHVIIYADPHYRGYSSYSTPKYYIRLDTDSYNIHSRHTWTFEKTENIFEKVHDRAEDLLNILLDRDEAERERKETYNRNAEIVTRLLPEAVIEDQRYSGGSTVSAKILLDERPRKKDSWYDHRDAVEVDFHESKQTFSIHRGLDGLELTNEEVRGIVEILKQAEKRKIADQKAREEAEENGSNEE